MAVAEAEAERDPWTRHVGIEDNKPRGHANVTNAGRVESKSLRATDGTSHKTRADRPTMHGCGGAETGGSRIGMGGGRRETGHFSFLSFGLAVCVVHWGGVCVTGHR